MSVKVLEFKPINNDKVVGFADVEFTSGMQMLGIIIIRTKDGDLAALPPGKPQLDQSGSVRKKANGKSDYLAIIKFRSREIKDNWSNQIVKALRETHGGMLS